MKVYVYYLKGTQINNQYSCKPQWFILKLWRHVFMIRVWRLQLSASWWPKLTKNKES